MLADVNPTVKAENFDGFGDFMSQDGILSRRKEEMVSPFAYMGLSIINPLSFVNTTAPFH